MTRELATIISALVSTVSITFSLTWLCLDTAIWRANLAQEICIKANSKAVSFDRIEVTCENKAVIPLKGG